MFTNNFYNFLRHTVLKTDYANTVSDTVSGLVDTSGAACSIQCIRETSNYNGSYWWSTVINMKPFVNNTVALGTGKTLPTLTDYELVEKCNNLNLSATQVISRELSAENVKILWTITGFNSNETEITISEIGLYKILNTAKEVKESCRILIARSLLPSPITVQSQENFLINYEVVI